MRRVRRRALGLAASAALLALPAAAASERFPEPRPADRSEAIEVFRAGAGGRSCLTPETLTVPARPFAASRAESQALDLLQQRLAFGREEVVAGPDGVTVQFTTAADSRDRLDPADADGNGRPDVLDTTLDALDRVHGLLAGRVGLMTSPGELQVLLVELGDALDGYLVPARRTRPATLALDATPRCGPEGARRAAIELFARAHVTQAAGAFPTEWADALATWTALTLDDPPNPYLVALVSNRLEHLGRGLLAADADLAAGNGVWLAFLDEAYGPQAVRYTLEELARGAAVAGALARGVERGAGIGLADAFREFQLWAILVGPRSDGHHFSFAEHLAPAGFASTAEGLPSLSVQSDPGVAPWGAVQVLLRPDQRDGGLRLVLDGEFAARWDADLILFPRRGPVHRLPLRLTSDGRGEVTVPVQGVAEAMLLIRNLGSEDAAAHRYTYSAHHVRGFPFDMQLAEAAALDENTGVVVHWETASEQALIGFNVLRSREGNGERHTINPVWVPALGTPGDAAAYQFLDTTAVPGHSYVYRIEGITEDGLTSLSEPIRFAPAPPR